MIGSTFLVLERRAALQPSQDAERGSAGLGGDRRRECGSGSYHKQPVVTSKAL